MPTRAINVEDSVSRISERLIEVSHTIHQNPELAFEEHQAMAVLAAEIQTHGFTVERGAYGLPTAFEAVRGTGDFRVVICAEYDALPQIGHACGHNIIAAAGLGAAVALGEVAEDYGLTVVLLGTPAEEHGGGKALLLERGAWNGATISLMVHGAAGENDVSCSLVNTQAVDRFDVTYTGRAAHAAAAPHEGINAGDAATVALVAIGLLRQQLRDGIRLGAFVDHGGEATNIIPAITRLRAEVRAFDSVTLEDAKERMLACFEGGAIATGCQWDVQRSEPRYEELAQNQVLAEIWDDQLRALGRTVVSAHALTGGSTDMGNVSQAVPSIHPMIMVRGATGVPHTEQFARDAATPAADEAMLHGALALAKTVLSAASEPSRSQLIKEAARQRDTNARQQEAGSSRQQINSQPEDFTGNHQACPIK
ncbi:amidohydrolase [Lysinibacter sp. HNR]|uniref:amidohydrolase n=1 Tax=Lysinibacter sp. HNR TaxID=3031408 RepID=UPI0024357E91|nr:amidohydrolase [Lysinibacter sp. HNR]WGD37071.1 amidohydrolase [Lysinibacter sp. HNR]